MMRSLRSSVLGLLAAGLLVALAACAVVPGLQEPPRLFTLTAADSFPRRLPKVSEQLLIEAPVAAAGLDTARIALRTAPTNLDYFANVNWTDRAPAMIQNLLVESFERSRAISAVGRESAALRSDWILRPELRDLEAEYPGDPTRTTPVIRVGVAVKLVAAQRRAIEASETFEAAVPAKDASFDAVIEAFDQALEQVLSASVTWTLERLARK
jgi:cholesterol transport system auxiliary component